MTIDNSEFLFLIVNFIEKSKIKGGNINRSEILNFGVALIFISVLSGSSVLTGATLGQVSQTRPFGMQHQETPLKLWTVDPPANNSQTAYEPTPTSDGVMNTTN